MKAKTEGPERRFARGAAVALCLLLLTLALTVLPVHGEAAVYDSVIRLHVLANSDSAEDQAVKLQVRDAVLAVTEPMLAHAADRDEAAEILEAHLDDVQAAAERALLSAGAEPRVRVTLTKEEYPTRRYENLAFPAGPYLSLRVLIGEAAGQNWWCVLFPPLCLSAATDKKQQEAALRSAGLTDEQYRIVTDTDKPRYRLRFKILEWLT